MLFQGAERQTLSVRMYKKMCIILFPSDSLAIGNNIRLRRSQDLRATAGKMLCTRRIARQNPTACLAYVST